MTIDESVFAVVDVESGGLDAATCDLLEIAVVLADYRGRITDTFETLVKPTMPIPPETSAVHHLIAEDFVDVPIRTEAIVKMSGFVPYGAIMVAHNSAFDSAFLPEFSDPWLCTKRLSMHVAADSPNSKNQTLRYFLGIGRNVDMMGKDPHRAIADAMVTAAVLKCLLDRYFAEHGSPEDDVTDLIAFANSPVLMTIFPLGDARGKTFDKVEIGLLQWVLKKQATMDPDLVYSVNTEIARRGMVRRSA